MSIFNDEGFVQTLYLIMPRRETVTYKHATLGESSTTDETVTDAWQRGGESDEVSIGEGRAPARRRTWYIPKTQLATAPRPGPVGDVIVDSDSVRWSVLEVDVAGAQQTWVLTCIREV